MCRAELDYSRFSPSRSNWTPRSAISQASRRLVRIAHPLWSSEAVRAGIVQDNRIVVGARSFSRLGPIGSVPRIVMHENSRALHQREKDTPVFAILTQSQIHVLREVFKSSSAEPVAAAVGRKAGIR